MHKNVTLVDFRLCCLINSSSEFATFNSCLCQQAFKLPVGCKPSYGSEKLLRTTFLDPDLLFLILSLDIELCHDIVWHPFKSPVCFLEFSSFKEVFNNKSSLSNFSWSILSSSSDAFDFPCSLCLCLLSFEPLKFVLCASCPYFSLQEILYK